MISISLQHIKFPSINLTVILRIKNMSSNVKKRISASHVEGVVDSDIGDYEMEMNNLFCDDDFIPSTMENKSDLMTSMALFFLKLEAKHDLSQTYVDSIVEEVDTLLGHALEK